MKALFVTGTDTAVGKTVITSAMAAFFSLKRALDVGVMKPFETGLSKSTKDLLPWDAICLKEASGNNDSLDDITPYTFGPPLAPEVAATLEHVSIDLSITDAVYKDLTSRHELLLIEGAGGVLVPIKKDFFFVDLIKRWNIPTLIVSRLSLGTINHTLLTAQYLRFRGVKVVGVIVNDTEGLADLPAKTNPDVLRKYLDIPLLGVFPHKKEFEKGARDRALLADVFGRSIKTDRILG
jgi:dethiobiotin synthetase